jgi:plastocyanin
MNRAYKPVVVALFLLTCLIDGRGQEAHTLTVQIEVSRGAAAKVAKRSNVVIWLNSMGISSKTSPLPVSQHLQLVQKNKSFEPHLLVIPVGSVVAFPNRDPFFHNVFSLFDGKRFDLGLYEAGTTRDVHFDKPGISYIFCNIHPEMSAVVVVLDTPYYGIANDSGMVTIPNVPPGRYTLHVWDERAVPQVLAKLTREVHIMDDHSLGAIHIAETTLPMTHKNKYGREYENPVPPSPIYAQP